MKSILPAFIFAEVHFSDMAGMGFFFLLLAAFILFIGLILLIPKPSRKVGKIVCLIGLGCFLAGGTMCAAG
ncbi:hypothetical protein QNI19_13610 [Cytophagaceae bacterium DM2B3-1]|uniref:Uncharacterized protein n=1 Tax=Xanthocytophaga flava TaxID=3048013 RepID=A0ABT7CJV2_9BACT|nr:hypothetical protein [Xanthocytophaga flavus]MDJ1469512.1 hypothetical protein [Xanthocytophaga flavus]MDJ1493975.1 hypothetical protein [Xanthocytophaga flavus]